MFHGSDPSSDMAGPAIASGLNGPGSGTGPVMGGWADAWALDSRPSLLIAAGREAGTEAAAMASGAGFRIAGATGLDGMAERLSLTVGVDALLVDLRGLAGDDPRLTRTLTALLAWPGWCDARPLLLADLPAVEAVAALLHVRLDRILCDPTLSDIGAELCLIAREGQSAARLSDIGRDTEGTRLEQLSAEVRRLAQTIDRLAREEQGEGARGLRDREQPYAPPPATGGGGEERGGATAEEVRVLLQARRLRERFLPSDLFADPAWDMMLDLLGARIDGKRVSVSSLCIASAVPPTTALRWIAQLTERGIFERSNDPDDARRVFISLSDEAAGNLSGWFAAARRTGIRFAI
ncbi:MAG: winged helix DNA-binding protein [Sphingobium sp.]